MVHVKTNAIYKAIAEDFETRFDTFDKFRIRQIIA